MTKVALYTSAEVASALRVGVSSVKRWTNDGELQSVKTPGGHRRYHLEEIHRFAALRSLAVDGLPAPASEEGVLSSQDDLEIVRQLMEASASGRLQQVVATIALYASRAEDHTRFLDQVVGEMLRRIGEDWESGSCDVGDEHRLSYAVAEGLDRARPSVPSGPLAVLACPPGELHDLPLRMVRLVLEWNGWRSEYLGASVPWDAIDRRLERKDVALLLFSARGPDSFSEQAFQQLTSRCKRGRVILGIGGYWARGGRRRTEHLERFRSLSGFEKWLRSDAVSKLRRSARPEQQFRPQPA